MTDVYSGETVIDMDPFGFMPDVRSTIAGLRDEFETNDNDPHYAFHTHYANGVSGHVEVELTFTGLRARSTQLMLTIHSQDNVTSAVSIVTTKFVTLRTIAATGNTATIAFEAVPELHYAVLGRTVSTSDASATGLSVRFRNDPNRIFIPPVVIARPSQGSDDIRPRGQLVTLLTPRLEAPVSQRRTVRQLQEPAYAEWRGTLGSNADDGDTVWSIAYLFQALKIYQGLKAGAKGLGFGDGYDPVAQALAAMGCSAVSALACNERSSSGVAEDVATDAAGEPVDADEGGEASPMPRVDYRERFDFLWSFGQCRRLASVKDVIYFVEDSLEYLKPGGLAVHVLDAAFGMPADAPMPAGQPVFTRNNLCQLGLAMVAGQSELAQLSFAGDEDGDNVEPFGVIVRKA